MYIKVSNSSVKIFASNFGLEFLSSFLNYIQTFSFMFPITSFIFVLCKCDLLKNSYIFFFTYSY